MTALILPKGVTIRNKRIQLDFMVEGTRCRELLPAGLPLNQSSINYAENKLRAIRLEIAEKRLNYAQHFPDSPRALELEGATSTDINRSISAGVDLWLEIKSESVSPATYSGYKSKAKHVKNYFKSKKLRHIKKIDIIKFRKHMINCLEFEIKTTTDVLTVLRGAFELAFDDGILRHNVMSRVKNLKQDEQRETQANPFNKFEIDQITNLKNAGYPRLQAINMMLFQIWTGLSFSEQMAVCWEDIDMQNWTLTVRRARVAGELKVPKEPSRYRTIDLLQPAIDIIKEQYGLTAHYPEQEFNVRRRSNAIMRTERLRFIFRNDAKECVDGIWKKKAVQSAYAAILVAAKVDHRGANQCRHTYASMLLTNYVPLELVSTLMGHIDKETTRKHYARVIPEDRPNLAQKISEILEIPYTK